MNSRLAVRILLFLFGAVLTLAPVSLHAALTPAAMQPIKETPDDSTNPYSVIVERNIFRLVPPPPPPDTSKPKADLPVVKITGFLNIGSTSKVLFVSQTKDKKDGPIYYSLVESEKSGDGKLELVKIHEAKDAVDVINSGSPETLTVKDNSLVPNTDSPAAGAAGGAKSGPPPPNPGSRIPGRPGFQPGSGYQPGGRGGPGGPGGQPINPDGLPVRMKRGGQAGQPGQFGPTGD